MMLKLTAVFFRRVLKLIPIILTLGAIEATAGTFTAFGSKTYVRDEGEPVTVTDTITILDVVTNAVVETVPVGNGPAGICVGK